MAPPVNDNFASSTTISGTNGSIAGTTVDATREGTESSTLRGGTSARSVWYTFTAPTSGWYKFALDDLDYAGPLGSPSVSADLYVFPNGVLTAMTQTSALAECISTEESPGSTATAVNLTSGTTYKIRVSAIATNNVFNFTLKWDEISSIAPANDLFANRIDLGSVPITETDISCLDAIFETSEPITASGFTVEQSVWYSFTPATTGYYDISVDPASIDWESTWAGGPSPFSSEQMSVQIGTGASASAFSQLAKFTFDPVQTHTSRTYISLTSGTEYIIRVSCPFVQKTSTINLGYNARASNFDLSIDTAPSAPANDDFANSEIISGITGSTSGTTLMATKEASEVSLNSSFEQSVWYKYTATATGFYKFIIAPSSLEFVGTGGIGSAGVAYTIFNETMDTLAEGTRSNELPDGFTGDFVGPNDVNDGHVYVQLYNGNTYYLKVYSSASSAVSNQAACSFELGWELVTGPVNDNLADAISLTTVPDTVSGTTLDASAEDGETNEWGFGQDQSVWYEFTPPSNGLYRFWIDNIVTNSLTGTRDLGLALYEGGSTHASLTLLGKGVENNDSVEVLAFRNELTAGTSYKIKVFTQNSAYNNFTTYDFDLNVDEITSPGIPPANDDIANAEDLGTNPEGIFSGSNIDATYEVWEDSYGQPSVWYKFTIDSTYTQTVTLTKTGTDPDWQPYAEIYTVLNDPPADFDDLDFFNYLGDDVQSSTVASTNIDWVPGVYYLPVFNWNFDSSWDDFNLEFAEFFEPPPNDNFANREVLPTSPNVQVEGTTSGATVEGSEPDTNPGGIDPPYPSIWYEWTSPNYSNEPLDFTIDTVGSTAADTYLEVFTGSSFFGTFTLIESDHNSGAGGKSQLTLTTDGDINYKIRISSPIGSQGNIVLNINAVVGGTPPANDDFENAELLTGYDDTTTGTTTGATAQPDDPPTGWDDGVYNTVWYHWVPPRTGRVRIDLETVGSHTLVLDVYRGTTLESLVRVENSTLDSFGGFNNWFYFSVEEGIDYYFTVQGLGMAEDDFTLVIHADSASSPANDDPSNATIIPVSPLTGTINPVTAGSNWDSSGPYAGDFVTNAFQDITVWYKIISPNSAGNITIEYNSDTQENNDFDGELEVYEGSSITSLTLIGSFNIPGQSVTVNIDAGNTYWLAYHSAIDWVTASDISFTFTFQDDNTDGFNPDPSGGSTDDFDSVTGTFVADDEDGEFVASGGVGYGTISPWTSPGTHYPYGWWTRFDIRSTSGDFLYRYGQTQQHIEIFRATRESGDYESIIVIGHKEGYQSIGYSINGGSATDTGYKVWGNGNTKGTTGKVRIEAGENGLTIDGRCFLKNYDTLALDAVNYFRDTTDDQFVDFDYGIRSYPGDGSAYIDLDPEWDFRYSNIKLHDDPETNVLGDADTSFNEVSLIEGWTTGQFLQRPLSVNQPSFLAVDDDHPPTVVVAPAEYSNGFAIDCTVTGTSIPELSPKGAQWLGGLSTQNLWRNKFCEAPADSSYPGISFGFYITDLPSTTCMIAYVYNQDLTIGGDEHNGYELHVGSDGTLYIRPARDSALIPFCQTEENKWNYIELQGDFHTRTYATKIWLDDFYMGRFETTLVPSSVTRVPLRPIQPNIYAVGRLSVSVPMGILFRDAAITRCKKDRPLGPTIIVARKLNGVGEHNYTDPETEDLPSEDVLDIANNGDFSGGTDGAGQPHYWTGYDRHDTGVPSGAMKLNYLFQTFGDSLVDTVADGSGPPGHEGETAMRITAVSQDGTAGDEDYSQAAYVFGGAVDPPVDLTYHYAYADTLSMQFWIKGIAGQRVRMDAESGIGGWSAWNVHTMTGDWEFVKLLLEPMSANPSGDNISAVTLGFPDSSPGDEFLVKAFHLYVNPDNIDANFYRTEDDGATVARINAESDDSSWELIDEFPPSDGSDHVYLNTYDLKTGVKGKENDGKTHLPPMMSDAYLEYTFGGVDVDDDKPVYAAKILMGQKGYSGPSQFESVDWDNYVAGISNIMIALSDGQRRDGGRYNSGIHISDEEPALFGFTLTRPPGDGPWTITKWNDLVIRLMSHEILFGTSLQIYNDYTNSAAIQGVWAEILMYDRRLVPPTCIRPIDLSRIRFRAHEDGDA